MFLRTQPATLSRQRLYLATLTSGRFVHFASNSRPVTWRQSPGQHIITGSAFYSEHVPTAAYSQLASVSINHVAETDTRNEVTPTMAYEHGVKIGRFVDDEFQRSVIKKLERLYQQLKRYNPDTFNQPKHSLLSKVQKRTEHLDPSQLPANTSILNEDTLCIRYGDVGTGKTSVMDLFYSTLNTERKRRVHFHTFMLDIHARVQKLKAIHSQKHDPIPSIAKDLANETYILCFDEFQVTDIADAMILRRLVTEMFKNGMIVVSTSNRHPDELYRNGIQRESFIPCIELIKDKCEIVSLDSGTDYPREAGRLYFSPLDSHTSRTINAMFGLLTEGSEVTVDREIHFLGRKVVVPLSGGRVARFTFEQLCVEAHSAADYFELVKEFDVIFVTDVPIMGMKDRNEARRFITLIDAMYENHTGLVMSLENSITHLFNAKAYDESSAISNEETRSIIADMDTDFTSLSSPLFTGEEEIFAFQRAVSRLSEMSTKQWALACNHPKLNSYASNINSSKAAAAAASSSIHSK
ncbi:ATPase [Mycoemilia scoparia]|uniref:ATPase n=1 Tax=Mycoemilia scoparia TaxID=417184 RepID=A0A9W8A6W2_9FUNG|nr:ATPase [Mycoemilia scoparia]